MGLDYSVFTEFRGGVMKWTTLSVDDREEVVCRSGLKYSKLLGGIEVVRSPLACYCRLLPASASNFCERTQDDAALRSEQGRSPNKLRRSSAGPKTLLRKCVSKSTVFPRLNGT